MNAFTPQKAAALKALVVEVDQSADGLRNAIRDDDFEAALAAIESFTVAFRQAYDVLRSGDAHGRLLS